MDTTRLTTAYVLNVYEGVGAWRSRSQSCSHPWGGDCVSVLTLQYSLTETLFAWRGIVSATRTSQAKARPRLIQLIQNGWRARLVEPGHAEYDGAQ